MALAARKMGRRKLGGREKGEEGVAHNPSIFELDGHFSSIFLMVVMATCLESTQPFLKLSSVLLRQGSVTGVILFGRSDSLGFHSVTRLVGF